MLHVWSVLCTSTIIDRESNKISLIDACDVLNFHGDPPPFDPKDRKPIYVAGFRLRWATLWTRSNVEIKLLLDVVPLLFHGGGHNVD